MTVRSLSVNANPASTMFQLYVSPNWHSTTADLCFPIVASTWMAGGTLFTDCYVLRGHFYISKLPVLIPHACVVSLKFNLSDVINLLTAVVSRCCHFGILNNKTCLRKHRSAWHHHIPQYILYASLQFGSDCHEIEMSASECPLRIEAP
jgi:hypothetical protein